MDLKMNLRHLVIPALLLLTLTVFPQTTIYADNRSSGDSTVVHVLYFHGTIRCHACMQIERFTDMTMQYRFSDKLKQGSIVWKAIDYEKSSDTASVNKYGIENQALIISKRVNGKEIEWMNLKKIWDLYEDYDAFQKYITSSVHSMLTKSEHSKETTR